jgi:hypothetical protein
MQIVLNPKSCCYKLFRQHRSYQLFLLLISKYFLPLVSIRRLALYLTCCKILGIKPGADIETIKAAYRKSAKELHPDVNTSVKAHDYFIILQNAYRYLLDHPYTPLKEPSFKTYRQHPSFNKNVPRFTQNSFKQIYHIQRYSLYEVLKKSHTARILYILFHIIFLIIGLFLIIRSVSDVIKFAINKQATTFSADVSVIFAIFLGITITTIFLFTGYSYIRDR